MSNEVYDLGNGYSFEFLRWSPDRELNPQYDGLPDAEKICILISCPHGNNGCCHLKQKSHQADYERIFGNSANWWDVQVWEPLTMSPSIQFLTPKCCHGYIRQGRWVDA